MAAHEISKGWYGGTGVEAPPRSLPASNRIPRANSSRRKVLIIEDEPSISNLLYVLLERLDYDGEVAVAGEQALAMIARESFDAVLLDLRYSTPSTEQMLSKITEIQPSLVDRVLVITGEVDDPQLLGLTGNHHLPPASRNRLMENVHRRLRALWGYSA